MCSSATVFVRISITLRSRMKAHAGVATAIACMVLAHVTRAAAAHQTWSVEGILPTLYTG